MTGSHVGIRIATLRRQRRLSQKALAGELGRSESWMSQVERGVQPVERLSTLQALADALGVTVHDLRPEVLVDDDGDSGEPVVNDLDAVRLCLSGHPALEQVFTPAQGQVDLGSLEQRVSRTWDLAHASRFADLSVELAELLPSLEQATRSVGAEADLQALHALRARTYQAAAAAFARQDEPDAAWVAADRAIAAAEQAGDPLDVIAGHFRLAHAFIRLRRYDQAERVTRNALTALDSRAQATDAPPELLSLYGAMHLVQAVISGHEGNRSQAHKHLVLAEEAASRLGEDRNDFGTEFGPTNVQLHVVAVAVDLADAGEALDVARRIDASHLSPERQARLLIDVARAHSQRRKVGDAVAALLEAEGLAPEHVRSHHLVRSTVEDLLTFAANRLSDDLRALANRLGINDQ